MPHWLAVALTATGAFTGLVAFVVAARKTVRSLRDAWRQLLSLLARIDDAGQGVNRLSQALHELAGSFVRFVAAVMQRQDNQAEQLDEIRERIDYFAELYTDINAAVTRNTRQLDRLKGSPDETRHSDD